MADPASPLSPSVGPAGPVWLRGSRPERARLTLDRVLDAAIELADAEGIEAVSVRRVAAALSARPMSLYSFFARKDDLLDLMADHVLGELVLDDLPTDWREALRAIAHRTFEVGARHPWLVAVMAQRPTLGPNAVRHAEQSFAAVAALDAPPEVARALLLAVDVYTMGFAAGALAETQMRRREGLTDEQWREATDRYLTELTADGRFPHLARIGGEALRHGAGDTFDVGLRWLLDGFAADALRRPDDETGQVP